MHCLSRNPTPLTPLPLPSLHPPRLQGAPPIDQTVAVVGPLAATVQARRTQNVQAESALGALQACIPWPPMRLHTSHSAPPGLRACVRCHGQPWTPARPGTPPTPGGPTAAAEGWR